MSHTPVQTEHGTWNIYWPHVERILRWYHRSEAMLAHRSERPVDDGIYIFTKPVMETVVDWSRVYSYADDATRAELRSYQSGGVGFGSLGHAAAIDQEFMKYMIYDLAQKIRKSQLNKIRFQKLNEALQEKNMKTIDDNVARWQTAIDTAKVVRDVSADIVIYGVGVATGGTGAILANTLRGAAIKGAASGAIKATFKFEDAILTPGRSTGSALGEAGSTFVGEFASALIPVKVEGKAGLIMVAGTKGVTEAGASLIAGKEFGESFYDGLAASCDEVGKEFFKSTVFKNFVASKALPLNASVGRHAGEFGVDKIAGAMAKRGRLEALPPGQKISRSVAAPQPNESVKRFVDKINFYAKLGQEFSMLNLAIIPPNGNSLEAAAARLRAAGYAY